MKTVAVILAAGEPRNMAHPKALLEHEGGKSFLQSLASTFGKAGCGVLAVVGKDATAVRAQHPSLAFVESERWRESPLVTIKDGVAAALEGGAEAVVVHPVDMPALRASTLKALLEQLAEGEVVRPEFERALGHPVILSKAAAQRLLGSDGAETLDAALSGVRVRRVPVKDPGVVVNINTPDTYERLFGSPPRLAPPPRRRVKKAEATS